MNSYLVLRVKRHCTMHRIGIKLKRNGNKYVCGSGCPALSGIIQFSGSAGRGRFGPEGIGGGGTSGTALFLLADPLRMSSKLGFTGSRLSNGRGWISGCCSSAGGAAVGAAVASLVG